MEDLVCYRTGKNQCTERAKHILGKSQTEASLEFQVLHPDVKLKQQIQITEAILHKSCQRTR